MNVYWIQKVRYTYIIIENKPVVTKNERKGGKDKLVGLTEIQLFAQMQGSKTF